MNSNMPYDLILFGATGFTGKLVAQTLQGLVAAGEPLRWAMAGRDLVKLQEVRQSLGVPDTVPLLLADAFDEPALRVLVQQTRIVISTVGPYQRYGDALVNACAKVGTDYVDLCGEPNWMAQKIQQLSEPAKKSGARIVFSCGFDSVPFDLGVVFLQTEVRRHVGHVLSHVQGLMRVMKGGVSGGTIASAVATIEESVADPRVAAAMRDPFALTPGFRGPLQPDGDSAKYLDSVAQWSGPFVMAPINTKNVHRTNALLGHPWGADFQYEERMLTGAADMGRKRALKMVRGALWQQRALAWAPARWMLRKWILPKPGEGPSAAARESGHYEIWFLGQGLRATVKGDRDPGYGSTAKMIAQSALCLLNEADRSVTAGGVWTPGAAMGLLLLERLRRNAGLSFSFDAVWANSEQEFGQ
jgi:short subunit dehydrogenase-like uncharacterized protein